MLTSDLATHANNARTLVLVVVLIVVFCLQEKPQLLHGKKSVLIQSVHGLFKLAMNKFSFVLSPAWIPLLTLQNLFKCPMLWLFLPPEPLNTPGCCKTAKMGLHQGCHCCLPQSSSQPNLQPSASNSWELVAHTPTCASSCPLQFGS